MTQQSSLPDLPDVPQPLTVRQHEIEKTWWSDRGKFYSKIPHEEFATHKTVVIKVYRRQPRGSDPCIFENIRAWKSRHWTFSYDHQQQVMDVIIIWINEMKFSIIENESRPTQDDLRRLMCDASGVEAVWSDARPGRQYMTEMGPIIRRTPPDPIYVPSAEEVAAEAERRERERAETKARWAREEKAAKLADELEALDASMQIGVRMRLREGGLIDWLLSTQAQHMRIFRQIDASVAREIGSMLPRIMCELVEITMINHRPQIVAACRAGFLPVNLLWFLRDDLAKLLPQN